MFVRNILLTLGVVCMAAGIVLSIVWFNRSEAPVPGSLTTPRPAVLVAVRAIPSGTLLRPEDIGWTEIGPGQIRAGQIVRGQMSDQEYIGAIARRSFAPGEPLLASELVRPNERQFLAAVLRPGTRAVTIAVDAPQSSAGLILPGDQVDVILTQSFGESLENPQQKTVAETVLRDVRIIAVDQSLSTASRPSAVSRSMSPGEPRLPRTVTFETTESQAERLFVAVQLGRLQLSVRPLEVRAEGDVADPTGRRPTWASDVSPALREMGHRQRQSSSTVESAVRRPPTSGIQQVERP